MIGGDVNRIAVHDMGRAGYFRLCEGWKCGQKAEQTNFFHRELPRILGIIILLPQHMRNSVPDWRQLFLFERNGENKITVSLFDIY